MAVDIKTLKALRAAEQALLDAGASAAASAVGDAITFAEAHIAREAEENATPAPVAEDDPTAHSAATGYAPSISQTE